MSMPSRIRRRAVGVALSFLLLPVVSGAQNPCRRDGLVYPEGARVCHGGILQTCVGANWQSLAGERCDGQNRYLNPGEAYVVQSPIIEIPAPIGEPQVPFSRR